MRAPASNFFANLSRGRCKLTALNCPENHSQKRLPKKFNFRVSFESVRLSTVSSATPLNAANARRRRVSDLCHCVSIDQYRLHHLPFYCTFNLNCVSVSVWRCASALPFGTKLNCQRPIHRHGIIFIDERMSRRTNVLPERAFIPSPRHLNVTTKSPSVRTSRMLPMLVFRFIFFFNFDSRVKYKRKFLPLIRLRTLSHFTFFLRRLSGRTNVSEADVAAQCLVYDSFFPIPLWLEHVDGICERNKQRIKGGKIKLEFEMPKVFQLSFGSSLDEFFSLASFVLHARLLCSHYLISPENCHFPLSTRIISMVKIYIRTQLIASKLAHFAVQ